jgi:uncharacterized membrane protein YdjX (TVP38/TMEM64 family)
LAKLRAALVLAVIIAMIVAWRMGAFRLAEDPQKLAQRLVELGAWGYLAFVLAYAALQPFGLPGTVFVFAAPLIWPWPTAFALSMTGTMAASVIGFSFCRFVARGWIEPRIPRRFRKYDDALATRAFLTVFTLRFVFWMPQLLHAFFGVSKVRFWTHFWGSLLGYLVPLFVVSFFGQRVVDWAKNAGPAAWIAVGAIVLVVATVTVVRRRAAA